MSELWIALDDFPAEGREFSFSDPEPFARTWQDMGLPGRLETMRADVRIIPRDRGALVKGSLAAEAVLPCDRCAEEFGRKLDSNVAVFEELPGEEGRDPEARVREEGGILHLNVGAVLWEEILLALPDKPVCSPSCKGLCDICGANLNREPCDCARDGQDPRMAVFRGLKLD